MIKKTFIFIIIAIMHSSIFAGYIHIVSEAAHIDQQRWEFRYTIENAAGSVVDLEWLTIWFDYDNYSNFEITTSDAGLWSESIIKPEPLTISGAGYDINASLDPLAPGQSVSGFSVSFDYTGQEDFTWVSQRFEVIDPQTWDTVQTGFTVPEPASLILLSTGLALIRLRKHKSY